MSSRAGAAPKVNSYKTLEFITKLLVMIYKYQCWSPLNTYPEFIKPVTLMNALSGHTCTTQNIYT